MKFPRRAQVPVVIYFRIFEVLLLVMVISIVAIEVKNVGESGIFQKKFISRDLALILDAIANARGNMVYTYNPPIAVLSKFDLDLRNGRVLVDDESWPYAENTLLQTTPSLEFKNPKGLLLTKTGNAFSIEEFKTLDVPFNALLLDCPGIPVRISKIILDPGHGYNPVTNQGEYGFVSDEKGSKERKESWIALGTAAALTQSLQQQGFAKDNILGTRRLEYQFVTLPIIGSTPFLAEDAKTTKERIEFIKKTPDALVVSLHTGKYDKGANVVKAFVNKDAGIESYRLACALLNALASAYAAQITGTAIIPVDLAQLHPDDPKHVLLKDRIAVQLEIGSIDYPNNVLYKDYRDLAAALAQGIKVFGS